MENFTALGLSEALVETIGKLGFETPTPIQTQAIPKLLSDETDLVGLAQTGTGKTAAFGLPLIDMVDTSLNKVQALILAPTRELCLQIDKELQAFSTHDKKLKILSVYGGVDIQTQIRVLRKGVHIVVATPGRLRDHLRRRTINLNDLDFVVLDEADEMLNMGFKEEIDDILSNTPDEKLTWLFSATMPREVRRIAQEYMVEPAEVSVRGQEVSNTDIDHQYIKVYPKSRLPALMRFLDFDPDIFGLVFCRTRRDTQQVAETLVQDGYNADAIHGDLSQAQRDRVMGRFRSRQLQVLVATDVAARGIDVSDITHVFHFNIPDDLDFYTHRSGRTGRAGSKGISMVLAHPNDLHLLKRLEKKIKIEFTEVNIPSGTEICEKQVLNHIQDLKQVQVNKELASFLPVIMEELGDFSKEELIERMASMSFNRFLDRYKTAPDLNHRKNKKKNREFNGKMHKLFINMGQMDVDNKGQLLAFICDNSGISGDSVGKIDMNRTHSYFDVAPDVSKIVKERFKNVSKSGRSIRVYDGEVSTYKKKKGKKRKHSGKKRK
jgi:ATP-dependent RNA helicase DeaD